MASYPASALQPVYGFGLYRHCTVIRALESTGSHHPVSLLVFFASAADFQQGTVGLVC